MTDVISFLESAFPDRPALRRLLEGESLPGAPALQAVSFFWAGGAFSAETAFGPPLRKPAPPQEAPGLFRAVTGEAEYPYLLYLPPGYDPEKRYPAILFLHGIGERGKAPETLAQYGPFLYALEGHRLPFIVFAPVVEKESHWVEDADGQETDRQTARLEAFIREMKRAYAVDEKRLSLTGLSMGGRGAYKLACYLPEAFCAVAVCCGRAAPREEPEAFSYPLEKMRGLPCWLFHGLMDRLVSPDHALCAARRLRQEDPKGELRLTLYPQVAHGCYEFAYRDARLYAWLEKQRRD